MSATPRTQGDSGWAGAHSPFFLPLLPHPPPRRSRSLDAGGQSWTCLDCPSPEVELSGTPPGQVPFALWAGVPTPSGATTTHLSISGPSPALMSSRRTVLALPSGPQSSRALPSALPQPLRDDTTRPSVPAPVSQPRDFQRPRPTPTPASPTTQQRARPPDRPPSARLVSF